MKKLYSAHEGDYTTWLLGDLALMYYGTLITIKNLRVDIPPASLESLWECKHGI